MFTELLPNFAYIALICAVCAFAIGIFLFSTQKNLTVQVQGLRHALAAELATRKQIEQDFRALLRCSQNMGKQLRHRGEPEEVPVSRALHFNFDPSESSTGDKVHELVERGLSVDEVASICGLTRGEVDFLSRFFDREVSPRLSLKAS